MPMISVAAPHQSIRCRTLLCGTLSTRATTISAMTPIGTFTKNTQRQPARPMMEFAPASAPPTTGPSTLEVPNTAMK